MDSRTLKRETWLRLHSLAESADSCRGESRRNICEIRNRSRALSLGLNSAIIVCAVNSNIIVTFTYMSECNMAIVYKLQRCNLFMGAVLCFAVTLEYVFWAIFRGSFGSFQGEFARCPRVIFSLVGPASRILKVDPHLYHNFQCVLNHSYPKGQWPE